MAKPKKIKSVVAKDTNEQKYVGGGWAVEHSEGTDYAPDVMDIEFASADDDLRPFDEGYDSLFEMLVEAGVTHLGAEVFRIYRVMGTFYREKVYGEWSRWGYGTDLLAAKECLEEDW